MGLSIRFGNRPRHRRGTARRTVGLVALAAVTAGLAFQVGGAQAATANLVTNPSVERVAGTKPYGWLQIGSGSNARTFRHLNGAAVDGRKFVRTMVTARRTGHAGWSFAPVKVVGGATYTYGDSYRSNTITVLRARYVNAAGTVTYRTFAAAPRSTGWKKAGISFTIPRGTVRLSMERLLTSPGTLDVDATLLRLRSGPAPAPVPAPAPAPVPVPVPTPTPTPTTPQPGSRALVSVTFDDGSIDHFTAAGPVLAQQGIPGTFYLVSNFVNGTFYMSVDQARTLQAAGHELGGHTASHANLTTLTPEQRTAELVDSKTRLEGWFGPIRTLAYPFGAYNADVLAQVGPLYQTARTTEGGVNVPGSLDRTRLRMRYVSSTTTAATVTQWMNEANTANAWTILVYHGIRTTNPDSETVTPDQFASHMAAVKASGLRTMTVSQAYAEVD